MSKKRAYINENTFAKINEIYSGKQESLERVIDNYVSLRRLALKNLRGVFTTQELTGMLSAFNGTIVSTGYSIPAKFLLTAQMEDADVYEGNSNMYSYSLAELLKKIAGLTDNDALFLLEEIHRFWNEGSFDLNDFLTEGWK